MRQLNRICILLSVLLWSSVSPLKAQNDLPAPLANVRPVKIGSLIVAMDTTFQKRPGFFNLKAYGLVNELLRNEIPVMWAIRATKTRTSGGSIDFSATTTRIFPDTANMGAQFFRSGAFIIDSTWVNNAWPIITAFGNNVNVYKTTAATTADIRYTLTHKPSILLLNSEGYDTIAVKVMQEAGINPASYRLQTPTGSALNSSGNWSLIVETHTGTKDTSRLNPLLRYTVLRGANLFMSCASIGAMENNTFTLTTAGIDSFVTGLTATAYINHDLPIAQFQGTILSPNGEFKLWRPRSGSSMRPNTYEFMRGGSGGLLYCMAGMKMRPNTLAGGNLFYVSGHEHYHWAAPTGNANDLNRINGRRILLNAIFIPASDSIEGIDFKTDVAIDNVPQSGFVVKDETFLIKVIALNNGPGTARNLNIQAVLPSGLNYSSFSATRGSYNPATGIWSIDSLRRSQRDTLFLRVIPAQLGNITFISSIENPSLEYNKSNNRDTLTLFVVSRPQGVNDTLIFSAPLFHDFPVKSNDSDEDGGPFSTSQIITGPFFGNALLLNGDSIRYTISAGFTGKDSIRYVTCDNYPLCDTAWFIIFVPSPLPVSLMNFGGSRDGEMVHLYWFTAAEKNNDRFEIERSDNGRSFEYRGFKKGNGTTNQLSGYDFTEEDPAVPMLYYRLVQYDFDGTSTTSAAIALQLNRSSDFKTEIFPNPGDGTLQVIRAQGVNGRLTMQLHDLSGRLISTEEWQADEDGFLIELFADQQPLAPGTYLATFQTDAEQKTIKVMIR
jgi:uncharacterized repeat protein (TIGR01451 family)